MRISYPKTALDYCQQIELLTSRGMTVRDPVAAAAKLRHLNYYRLSAYWYPFKQSRDSDLFIEGTDFDNILEIYNYDCRLRSHVMRAIEVIEISVRAQWAFQLGMAAGPYAYLNPEYADDRSRWLQQIGRLYSAVDRSEEQFIQHLADTYLEPLSPIWAICETMTIGELSHWYKNMKQGEVKHAISRCFGLRSETLSSWLHCITIVRNICAHHCRLWNRNFRIKPITSRTVVPAPLRESFHIQHPLSGFLYNILVTLCYLVEVIGEQPNWRMETISLVDQSPDALQMGFTGDWKNASPWR